MVKFNYLTAILIIFIIFYSYKITKDHFLIKYCKQESSKDGKDYYIQCDYNEKTKAANYLYELNKTALTLIDRLSEEYINSESDAGMLTRNLVNRYRGKNRLVETNPNNNDNDTSFVLDKGWLLSLCIRCSKNKDETCFHDLNMLKFVLIHELSHIAANVHQHPARFWDVFKWLLKKSKEYGLYNYYDFRNNPILYCDKLKVNYTPEDDNSLLDISTTQYYQKINSRE